MSRKKRSAKSLKKRNGAPAGPPSALLQQASAHHQAGRLDEATALYGRVLEAEPKNPDALHLLGVCAYQSGRLDEAEETISRAIEINPGAEAYYGNLGLVLKDQEKLDEAEEVLVKALGLNPQGFGALNNLGLVLQAGGRFDEAEEVLRKAIAVNPAALETLYHLGVALDGQGRLDEAEGYYRQVVEKKGDHAKALYALANVLYRKECLIEALTRCREAVELMPRDAAARHLLGALFLGRGDPEAAESHFREAISINPVEPGYHSSLGLALKDQGRFEEAETALGRALELCPGFPDALSNLGLVLRRLGRFDEAENVLRRALELNPDFIEAWFNLEAVFGDRGDLDAIMDCGERLMTLAPERQEVYEVLAAPLSLMVAQGGDAAARVAAFLEKWEASLPDSPWPLLLNYSLRFLAPESAGEAFEAFEDGLPSLESNRVGNGGDENESDGTPGQLPVIALFSNGRSGTGFLHSLVDGHPQISTLPGVYMKGFFGPGVWSELCAGGAAEIGERFAAMYEVLFDATDPNPVPGNPNHPKDYKVGLSEGFTTMGEDGTTVLGLDRKEFLTRLNGLVREQGAVHQGDFFRLMHMAFEKALGRGLDFSEGRNRLFYHIHNPDFFELASFLKYYPRAKLLMTVREPLQNLESWLRRDLSDATAYSRIAGKIFVFLVHFSRPEFARHQCAGLRLEDLKNDPETTLRRLCAWMEVEESDALYESTMQGLKWWGEPGSATEGSKDQFGKGAIERKVGSVLSEKDQLVFATLFAPFSRLYGYSEENGETLAGNLEAIGPLLDEPLDFEKTFWESASLRREDMEKTVTYRYLRLALRSRWEVLRQHGTYPFMVPPLPEA
ncbi:MAG: tetratricopeptide repeat protein [Alphaproteobacteria bacterium]|nr:tetratricopeptide repeat protein [Alphaproteobacteria bacterium]